MSLLKPAYKLIVGRRIVDATEEPKASTAVELKVELDLDAPADSLTLLLGNVGGLRPERGEVVRIELGHAGNGGLTQVWAGKVAAVAPGVTTTRVTGYSAADALLRSFAEKTFEDASAGEIVRELAGLADVEVAKAEDGIRFPARVVDGRRSLHEHMRALAALCGFDLYLDSEGRLVFGKFVGGRRIHVFEFGKHVVRLDFQRTLPRAGRVEAWGESPAGSQGQEAWGWLAKDFGGAKGQSGVGEPLLLLEDSSLRTSAGTAVAAEALMTAIQRRTLRGRLLALGRPEVMLGDAIQLRGMPEDGLNGTFQARSIVHRMTKLDGFTTAVSFQAIQA